MVILGALHGKQITVYGKGENVRDWIHVEDHAAGLLQTIEKGCVGETYNIGSSEERRNIDLVRQICGVLDRRYPQKAPHDTVIYFVEDRPGHDFRYAIDSSKIRGDLGWAPSRTFEKGLAQTVEWYPDNDAWWQEILHRSGVNNRYGLGR